MLIEQFEFCPKDVPLYFGLLLLLKKKSKLDAHESRSASISTDTHTGVFPSICYLNPLIPFEATRSWSLSQHALGESCVLDTLPSHTYGQTHSHLQAI